MSSRGAILLAIGMLVLGLVLGGLMGGAAGFFMGQNVRQVTRNVAPFTNPRQQQQQPNGNQTPSPNQNQNPNGNQNPRGFVPFRNIAGGARVDEIDNGSPAAKAGLQVGDIITAVGGVKLDSSHSLSDLVQTHKPGEKVDFSVTRGTQTMVTTIELGTSSQNSNQPWIGIRYTPMVPGGRFQNPNG